ncbi:MAG: hypothetical protein D6675_13870 [Gemmatimonadetes bacterium]|nr:MAG: hypothetical protein D6675_13870 [Gemmatimonadota bacterium]
MANDRTEPVVYLLLALLAFFLPALYYVILVQNGVLTFYGFDGYYHMRHAQMILHQGYIAPLDFYNNYPEGLPMRQHLFSYLLAGLTFLLTLGDPVGEKFEWAAAVVPPLMNIFSIWLLYYLGKTIADRRTGFWAAVLFMFFSPHLAYVLFGRPDHHCIEAIFYMSLVLSMVKGIQSEWKAIRWAVVFGISLTLALLNFTFIVVFLTIFLIFIYLYFFFFKEHKAFTSFMALGFFITCVSILPYYLLDTSVHLDRFIFNQLSGLHFLLFFYTFLALFLYRLYLQVRPANLIIINVMLIGVVILFMSQVLESVMGGANFVAGTSILEFENLSADEFFQHFSYSVVSLPFILGFLFYQLNNRKLVLLFCIWSILFGALAIQGFRFAEGFSLVLALLLAFVMVKLWDIYQELDSTDRIRSRVAIFFLIGFVSILAMGYYSIKIIFKPAHYEAINEVGAWLKEHTPPTCCYYTSEHVPEYGILTHYNDGFSIIFHAHRPTTGSNMRMESAGNRAYHTFLLSEDESEAYQLCQDLNVRYVMVPGSFFYSYRVFESLEKEGRLQQDYFDSDESEEGYVQFELYDRFYRTMGTALGEMKGHQYLLDKDQLQGLSHFRLVFESSYLMTNEVVTGSYVAYLVYERVPGAKLVFHTLPEASLKLTAPLTTNTGSHYEYQQHLVADSTGIVQTVVPYATVDLSVNMSDITTAGPYTVTTEQDTVTFEVTEEMIQNAGFLQFDLR